MVGQTSELINTNLKPLETIKCNHENIEEIVKSLQINKYTGPDKLGKNILKANSKSLSKSLSVGFQNI